MKTKTSKKSYLKHKMYKIKLRCDLATNNNDIESLVI